MKKILKQIVLALLIFSIAACEDDFLDRQPLVGTSEANFYVTEADALAAVNAAYATLQFEMSPAGHFRWFWGDIMSDDSVKGGSGDNDQPALAALENFQGPTDTDFLNSEWESNYLGIYRANIVLEKVPDIEMDEVLQTRILAEARFIRAWFHYNQVTIFGRVPLVDHTLSPSEYLLEQSEPSEVWAFIEADLLVAIEGLPNRSGYAAADLGRITKGAAEALLAKALMYQSKYDQALPHLESIVNSNEYALVADFGSIFTEDGENNIESVFEINYMNASGGNWGRNAQNEGTFTPVFQRARGQFGGFGFNIPTQDLVEEFFEEGFEDPRLKFTVFRQGEPMGDRGLFTIENAGGYPYQYYSRKYFANSSQDAPFGDPNPNGGLNDRVIRYADVLLMHAECHYHAGSISQALSSINMVRARARGTSSNILPDLDASGQDLLDAIYRERRLELALEGHRFFDLVRTGRAESVLGEMGYSESTHRVFPIPLNQILATNGVTQQNPGY